MQLSIYLLPSGVCRHWWEWVFLVLVTSYRCDSWELEMPCQTQGERNGNIHYLHFTEENLRNRGARDRDFTKRHTASTKSKFNWLFIKEFCRWNKKLNPHLPVDQCNPMWINVTFSSLILAKSYMSLPKIGNSVNLSFCLTALTLCSPKIQLLVFCTFTLPMLCSVTGVWSSL